MLTLAFSSPAPRDADAVCENGGGRGINLERALLTRLPRGRTTLHSFFRGLTLDAPLKDSYLLSAYYMPDPVSHSFLPEALRGECLFSFTYEETKARLPVGP